MTSTTISTVSHDAQFIGGDDALYITRSGELRTDGTSILWSASFGEAQLENRGIIESINGFAVDTTSETSLGSSFQFRNFGQIFGSANLQNGGRVDFTNSNGAVFDGSITTGGEDDLFNISGTVTGDIIGNGGDDKFFFSNIGVVWGSVDGGSGRDVLTIDHGGALANYPFNEISADASGNFRGLMLTNASAGVRFSDIEDLTIYLAPDSGSVRLDATPLLGGATLDLRGEGSPRRLDADFSKFSGIAFKVSPDGTIQSTYGAFAGFSSFKLDLGAGHNDIVTGAGDDWIVSRGGNNVISTGGGGDFVQSAGGVDFIDAGDQPLFGSIDSWVGDFSSANTGISLSVSHKDISVSNGSLIKGFERADINLSASNDSVILSADSAVDLSIGAGAGFDSLLVDRSRVQTAQNYNSISSTGAGEFSGRFLGLQTISFSNFERVAFRGGTKEVFLDVDAASVGLGGVLDLDGGTGSSTLSIDFSALSSTQFMVNGLGEVESNYGYFSQWETYFIKAGNDTNIITTGNGDDQVTAGNGSNRIMTGAGDDVIATGGLSNVDGGEGNDSWNGYFLELDRDIVFTVLKNGASIDNGSIIENVESISLAAGSGGVTFLAGAATDMSWYFAGGLGVDTLFVDRHGVRDGGLFTVVTSDNGGVGYSSQLSSGSNAYGPTSQAFSAIDNVSIRAGDDVDVIFYDVDVSNFTSSTGFEFDGGGGRDALSLQGIREGYTVDLTPEGRYRITDIDTENGNNGVVYVSNVERLLFQDQELKLVYYSRSLKGSERDDALNGSYFDDAIFGLAGDDVINGGNGNDYINGGSGNDTASYSDATRGVAVNLALTSAQSTYNGRDTLIGIENVTGSAFADGLRGDGNANVLDGGAGNDNLFGFGGSDTLIGGAGNDTLDGGAGSDVMTGGVGGDTYIVDNVGDEVHENPGEGIDTVKASVTYAIIATDVEKLIQTGTDNIDAYGNGLGNTLTGNAGNNLLYGDAGQDIISGGAGNDTLIGGAGADILTGGTGNDRFVFDSLTVSANKDTIKDFVSGQDTLVINRSVFAAFAGDLPGALSASNFTLGTKATTLDQHLIYNSATGVLFYDADGSGSQSQVQIALLTAHPLLVASDFLLG